MKTPATYFVLLLAAAFTAHAQIDWPTLQSTVVASGASHPVYLTHAGDGTGRVFVVNQTGKVLLLSGTGFAPTPFLDISSKVLYGGEQGLLSIAFPPGFASKGHFYAAYARAGDGASVIGRFSLTSDPNVADAGSEQVVWTIPQPYSNHNGGQLQFGPDGYLYWSKGDGGNQGDPDNRAQNLDDLHGKLLRIDVEGGSTTYTVPADNPYVQRKKTRPEIWARGLRNPWRFSFDRQTGDLYIGDVGQNRYEEIDFQAAGSKGGQNYGWRLLEGTHGYDIPSGFPAAALLSLTPPVAQVSHPSADAIIGGFVYRGTQSARMSGMYFYGDYGSGRIWGMERQSGRWISKLMLTTGDAISSFGEDEAGEVYYTDVNSGKIHKLADTDLVWTPTILPAGGTFPTRKGVIIRSASPGAALYYTTDGSDPTPSDTLVPGDGRIILSRTAELKVRAFRTGLEPSTVATARFSIQ